MSIKTRTKESTSLTQQHIDQLIAQGCSADNWKSVTVSPSCDLSRIHHATFIGRVSIGTTSSSIILDGVQLPCGVFNAVIANCMIGDNVRIANIGSVISGYTIENDVVIEDTASISAELDAVFGNGIELDVVNEAGGRGTKIFNGLSSQTAYLQAIVKHHPAFSQNISSLIDKKIKEDSTGAVIGEGARIIHCGSIKNVSVGPFTALHGIQHLANGTILSCKEHPTFIGQGVHAQSFVIAEGAKIDSGALLDKVFIGQGVKMGKQYSAENSVFFANCEGFHGEAVSLFAGPYTVTHHKSTLLIAGLFSFYNAGSGSNQSNHMYKLGPVHQGVFERGCKTGSFSYVLLESHIGAFSVVIGKHFTNINAPNLPFSYIHEEEGVSKVIPGMNLFSVGTVRDGEKWPKRDNRKAPVKRDLIIFDVFSPYTVEKMRRGRNDLLSLSETTSKEKAFITYGGLQINRLLLRKGAKYYSMAISRYVNDKVCKRISDALRTAGSWSSAIQSLAPDSDLAQPEEWTDLSGLLTPCERRNALIDNIASEHISSYDDVTKEFQKMVEQYHSDEWSYVYHIFKKEYSIDLVHLSKEQAIAAIEEWQKAAVSLHAMILEDSKKEFGAFAKIGYGIDMNAEERDRDFTAVRGTSDTNSVVQKLEKEAKEIQQRHDQFITTVSSST